MNQQQTLPQGKKRAIIYARVSTDQQAEYGTSIDNQVEKSLAYARAKGMQIAGIFKEDYSGQTLDRPELNKVRAMLQAKQADVLVIYKADRQDRSWAGVNYLLFLQELQLLGIEFHKSEQGRQINLNDATQILLETIEGWQAGTDHKRTVERMHKGKINLAQSGHIVAQGHPPFGYEWIMNEKTRRKEFTIVEDEASVVRRIFHWYAFGDETGKALGRTAIAMKLSEMGIETYADRRGRLLKQAGSGVWHHSTIGQILDNETYIGIWRYAKKRGLKRGYVGQNEPIEIPVDVPAIISQELFDLVKQRREIKAKVSNRKKHDYLLAGHLKCGCCGLTVHGKPTTRKNGVTLYYACASKTNKSVKERTCDNPHFRADQVDPAVWAWLERFIFNEDELIRGLKDYQAAQSHNPLEQELSLVKSELANKEAEFIRAMEDMKAAISRRAKTIIAQDIERIEALLDALESRRAELESELENETLTDAQIMDLMEFAAMLRADWEVISQDYDSKRELLARLNIKVALFIEDGKPKARISGKVTSEEQSVFIEATTSRSHSSQHDHRLYKFADEPTSRPFANTPRSHRH